MIVKAGQQRWRRGSLLPGNLNTFMKHTVFQFIVFFVFCYTVHAQEKAVHVVTMEGDHPVHGATVLINGHAQASTNTFCY